ERFRLTCEAVVWRAIYRQLPAEFPSKRELLIQNAKLHRMLDRLRNEEYALELSQISGGPSRKQNKRHGANVKRATEQRRKVMGLAERQSIAWFKRHEPVSTATARKWLSDLSAYVRKHADEMAAKRKAELAVAGFDAGIRALARGLPK